MLLTLKIKNFALISDQTISFKKGFNVLVGETGAGKSLILDALNFVLGDKSNKINIRHGQNKMFVQAVFDCTSSKEVDILNQNGIEVDDTLIFTRSLTSDSRSECRVNGVIVPVFVVKALAQLLVDSYAQNENIELLKVKNHLDILDRYGEQELKSAKENLKNVFNSYKEVLNNISSIGGSRENRDRELELLDYQIKDIESANLFCGEDDELKAKLDKFSNYEKIFDNVNLSNSALSQICDGFTQIENALLLASKYDASLSSLYDRVVSAKIELSDVNDSLSDYLENSEYDSNLVNSLSERYEKIKNLKKKYGETISDVLNYLNKIKDDYDNLLFGEEKLSKLEVQKSKLENELFDLSCELSAKRKKIALTIEKNVEGELKMLGFKNAHFKVAFKDIIKENITTYSSSGLDDVEFMFSANMGEELKSLSKTISGGEMSRFMLAVKNVFAKCFETSTLIFDEVDVGISGEIGQKVAERLAMLATSSQLICITHLSQSTAMADNYIYVSKTVESGETFTQTKNLNGEEIISYIATVSGATPSEAAISFARELKDNANKFKKSISGTI